MCDCACGVIGGCVGNDLSALDEIFEAQRGLNDRILKRMGVNTNILAAQKFPHLTYDWLMSFNKAYLIEFGELIEAFGEHFCVFDGWNSMADEKIEVVDMLHFLVSMSLVTGVVPSEVVGAFKRAQTHVELDSITKHVIISNMRLTDCGKWKWWGASEFFYYSQDAHYEVIAMWITFASLCRIFDMDVRELHDIYMKKNQVNHERQDNGYNEQTKTEADNQTIAKEINYGCCGFQG